MSKSVFFILLLFGDLIIGMQSFAQKPHQHLNTQIQQLPISDSIRLSKESIELLITIQEETRRFKKIDVARDEGYVPFGPDMPNMGEHFVNPVLAVSRDLNLHRPSVLTYLMIGDEPVLTGVAYTIPVQPNEQVKDPLFSEAQWHFHSGDLLKEAYGLHNHTMHQDDSDKVRLGMLHAWIWSGNPEGIFVADNWVLNLLRLGIEHEGRIHPSASKALFLQYNGVDYYTRFVELAAEPDAHSLEDIREKIISTNLKVMPIVTEIINQGRMMPEDELLLIDLWEDMWLEIEEVSNPKIWSAIEMHLPSQ
jgi:hypothetical protein